MNNKVFVVLGSVPDGATVLSLVGKKEQIILGYASTPGLSVIVSWDMNGEIELSGQLLLKADGLSDISDLFQLIQKNPESSVEEIKNFLLNLEFTDVSEAGTSIRFAPQSSEPYQKTQAVKYSEAHMDYIDMMDEDDEEDFVEASNYIQAKDESFEDQFVFVKPIIRKKETD